MMESVSNMLNCMINAHVLFVMSKRGQSINVDILVGLDVQGWLVDGVNLTDRQ